MAKKRVFLDECCSQDLRDCFPAKSHVYVAKDLGVSGKEDTRVIDGAITKGCFIVTVNKDFLGYYRDHPLRKGKSGKYFYGLMFLKPSKSLTKKEQLKRALKSLEWEETRGHHEITLDRLPTNRTTVNL